MNPTKRIYPNAADEILQAAETVAIDEGLASLTIDRVAAVSGKSKGGVLYHFPSKEALIKGMIDRIGQAQIADIQQRYESSAKGPGDLSRAVVNSFIHLIEAEGERFYRLAATLMAAVVYFPHLLNDMRTAYQGIMQQMANDGLSPMTEMIILATADGLCMHRMLNLYPFDPSFCEPFKKRLLDLIDQSVQP